MKCMLRWSSVLICIAGLCLFLMPPASSAMVSLHGHYRMYPGPALPAGQVAIIAFNRSGDANLELDEIDGIPGPDRLYGYNVPVGQFALKSVVEKTRFVIELPPGLHRLSFSFYSNYYKSVNNQIIEYAFEPGMLYEAYVLTYSIDSEERRSIDPKNRRWKPDVKRVGPIPEDYVRPTVSCESFKKNRNPQVCLLPGDTGVKPGLVAASPNSITTEFTAAGASFTIAGGDIHEVAMGQVFLNIIAIGLDLGKEADRAEFLIRYAKQRIEHPELTNLIIKCKQFQMP